MNGKRYNPEGEFVLYWMQSTHRLTENWALRAAVRAADRISKPLVVHQGLDPTYPHASDRHHTFILQGARDTAREAGQSGYHYHFALRRNRGDDRRVVDRIAARAYVVITDLFPTAGVHERTKRFASRVGCRVLAIDSYCTVPSGVFEKPEFAARTIRPKILRLLDQVLEPVEERAPVRAVSSALNESLADTMGALPLALTTMTDEDIAAEIATCEIDHNVARVHTDGGSRQAQSRLSQFVEGGLSNYSENRNEAGNQEATSRLSPYLHYGQIAPAQLLRSVLSSSKTRESIDAFVGQVAVWRDLAFNWCLRGSDFDKICALPDWVQRTMQKHVNDKREQLYDLATLERAETNDELWNAAQRQLLNTGIISNYPRMLWGKALLPWSRDYETALSTMLYLNDKWAIDGRDPNSVGNIMWCLGLWDRPWGDKPIWGGIRPMVTRRAKYKFDVDAYIQQNSQ